MGEKVNAFTGRLSNQDILTQSLPGKHELDKDLDSWFTYFCVCLSKITMGVAHCFKGVMEFDDKLGRNWKSGPIRRVIERV